MPPTPVSTSRNVKYGGPEAQNKYSPLGNLALNAADSGDYDGFVDARQAVFDDLGLFPAPLELALPVSWSSVADNENTGNPTTHGAMDPPLVVVSSNRANWILAGINRANAVAGGLPGGNFNNLRDNRGLQGGAGYPQSPPLYAPKRQGANQTRSVFIVVHQLEYNHYKTTLAGTGVNVVGWRFAVPGMVGGAAQMSGFGASRFAALEFCKALRRLALERAAGGAAPWDLVWLLDDNVVAFNPFAGLGAVETALTAAANTVCAGFSGCRQPLTRAQNTAWYGALSAARKDGTAVIALPAAPSAVGLIQQAALWNVAQLDAGTQNFGPWFVTAKEDVSFTNYFDSQPAPPYQWYDIRVRKEDANPDGTPGAAALGAAKDALTAAIVVAEGPIQVQAPADAGGTQALSNYVNTQILPNGSPNARAMQANAQFQALTVSRAMEQIITRAIKGTANPPPRPAAASYLAAASRNLMFAPPGGAVAGVGALVMPIVKRVV